MDKSILTEQHSTDIDHAVTPGAKLLLDVHEAAAMLGCGKTTFYTLLSHGEIPLIKIGRLTKIPTVALNDYVTKKLAERAWTVAR